MIQCYVCRDEGTIHGCEKCGKTLMPDEKLEDMSLSSDETLNRLVPEYYRGKSFNSEELLSAYEPLSSDAFFKKYLNTLNQIYDIFRTGKLPPKSGLVISPKRFGKTVWAYSCLKVAYMNGYSVFPILDTQQIKRFLTLAVEKPYVEYIKKLKYTYEDFINADVVFISVVKDSGKYSAYEVIDQVLDMRSRNGKITFILSEFSVKTISYYDRDKRFDQLFISVPGSDGCRYPGVISYTQSLIDTAPSLD